MKKRNLAILLFIFLGIFFSCSENESVESDELTITDPLHGVWNMVSLVGGDFSPVNITYEIGDRIWTFDTIDNTLTFEDNIFPESTAVLSNSITNYAVTENDNGGLDLDRVLFNPDGSLAGSIPMGFIETLTEIDLVIRLVGVSAPVYTFEKN